MRRGEAWIDIQMKPKNLFSPIGSQGGAEVFDELISMSGVRLERIFSHGCPTPPDEWYDQGSAEWVVLLRGHAVLEWENGAKDSVSAGDFFVIPPHQRHRIDSVSSDAVWLALHYEDC
jgi:cupin 2 domain-containing protein